MSNENNHENMASQQTENSPTSSGEKAEYSTDKQVPDTDLGESCIEQVNKLTLHDESGERNTGVAVKNVENESLNSLLVYDSDSSSSSSSSSSEMMKLNLNWQSKDDSDDTTTSSSSSSEEEEESDSESSDDDDDEQNVTESNAAQSKGAIRKDGCPIRRPLRPTNVLAEEPLPPVPDLSTLNINVENEEFIQMGSVLGIVDKLVTVTALPNTPAYDLDTLLFLDNGKRPLGFVFDVLGQVTSPIYAIRFNSAEDIKNLGIEVGTKVYSAPTSKHTQYVFLQQLLKLKGSDASWKDDTECPPEFADFSDDENECYHRHGNRKVTPNMKRTSSSDNYKKFETTMNKRNLLNTKFNKYMDSYKQARLNRARRPQVAPQISTTLPSFDPTVPPPNLRQQMAYYQHYGGGVHYMQPEYVFLYDGVSGGGENNNSQGYQPRVYMNNFVANLSQTNSANYFTNHAGNNHPGPSHE